MDKVLISMEDYELFKELKTERDRLEELASSAYRYDRDTLVRAISERLAAALDGHVTFLYPGSVDHGPTNTLNRLFNLVTEQSDFIRSFNRATFKMRLNYLLKGTLS